MSKSKNWENDENTGNFKKIEKPKMWALENVIRKAYANFQEASSIGNI